MHVYTYIRMYMFVEIQYVRSYVAMYVVKNFSFIWLPCSHINIILNVDYCFTPGVIPPMSA